MATVIDATLVSDCEKLKKWRDPSYLEEAELIPPTDAAIDVAELLIAVLQSAHRRMVPDGDGGIVFDWPTFSIEIGEDGAVALTRLSPDGSFRSLGERT